MDACKAILDAVMDEMDAENCSLMLKIPCQMNSQSVLPVGSMREKPFIITKVRGTGGGSKLEKGSQAGFSKRKSGFAQ